MKQDAGGVRKLHQWQPKLELSERGGRLHRSIYWPIRWLKLSRRGIGVLTRAPLPVREGLPEGMGCRVMLPVFMRLRAQS